MEKQAMKLLSSEKRIRAGLPLIRILQSALPIRLTSRLLKQSMTHFRLHGPARLEAVTARGVPCQWIIPPQNHPDRVLLYLHGGGFVFGQTPLHMQMAAYLAKKTTFRILMVDYRLAPDQPFPAALDDTVGAYQWLLEKGFSSQNIVIAGDSAGGNLTVTCMLKLREEGSPLPAAAVCISPVMDLTGGNGENNDFDDPLLPAKVVQYYSQSYIGDHDGRDPLISPVFGDLSGLPPILVHMGENERLRQGATRFVELAKAQGVDVHLEIFPRMWHVFQLYLSLPQALQSLDEIAKFLVSQIEAGGS
jgi:monoterpene epsilon-lactone hydrolase